MTGGPIVIAGGSGLIGQALAASLADAGRDVVILTREPSRHVGVGRAAAWDPSRAGAPIPALEGASAVVNLAGRNVNTRWTQAARRELRDSRLQSSRAVGAAFARCDSPPGLWINVSGANIYGDRGDELLPETASVPMREDDFLASLCREWEAAATEAQLPDGVRRIIPRLGVVLSPKGGAFPLLVRLTRLFAGGHLGSGRQWMPWIHVDDAVSVLRWMLETGGAAGVYNVVSPQPATNAQFMRALRRVLHRPWAPPAPAWAARLAGGALGLPVTAALASLRMVPRRLEEEGFRFQHPELEPALATLVADR